MIEHFENEQTFKTYNLILKLIKFILIITSKLEIKKKTVKSLVLILEDSSNFNYLDNFPSANDVHSLSCHYLSFSESLWDTNHRVQSILFFSSDYAICVLAILL